jgi:hypothetical protein
VKRLFRFAVYDGLGDGFGKGDITDIDGFGKGFGKGDITDIDAPGRG